MKKISLIHSINYFEDIKKTEEFKSTSNIWNSYHFNSSDKVGKCSQIVQEYKNKIGTKQPNLTDFEKFYYKRIKKNRYIRNANNFRKVLERNGISISKRKAIIYQFIRVVYDSFYGLLQKETQIMDYLQNDENFVEHSDEKTDRIYGIDIVVLNNFGFFEGVQVKPISFLYSIKNCKKDVVNDLGYCLEGNKKWLKINGNSKVKWLFYSKNNIVEKSYDEMRYLYDYSS